MIFNLFKSKPTLKDLIPNGFVDIHSHILPGIDDGAKNLEQSLLLIKKMGELGFSKIIGTPHTYPGLYNNTTESIKNSFDLIEKEELENVKIGYASEYMLDNSLIEKAQDKSLLCIKDNYILVEMSFISSPVNLYDIIFELRHNNYIPIIAHPERYFFLHNNFKEYHKLKKVGCLFQINLLSLIGLYGLHISKITEKLINKGLVDFTGSDVHSMYQLKKFEDKIKLGNTKELERLFLKNSFFED